MNSWISAQKREVVLDRDFVLRFDGTGRNALHDAWTELWPGVAGALGES